MMEHTAFSVRNLRSAITMSVWFEVELQPDVTIKTLDITFLDGSLDLQETVIQ